MSMDRPREQSLEEINIRFDKLSKESPQDVARAIQLLDSIWQSAGRDFESQFPELYPDAPPFDGREYNKNYWAVKDEKTGEVIGIVGYSEFKGDLPEHAWLGWFCVKKELRGKNLGVEMVEHVVRQLRALGKTDLYVQTSDRPNMVGNEKFYDRCGFPVVARMDTNRTIHIFSDAGDLSEEVVRTVVGVNDKDSSTKDITNFIRRRPLIVA